MSILNDVIRVWVSRLAEAISLPSDSDEEKLGKAVLLLIVMLGILVGLSLGVAYMLLRIPLAASFPLGFSLLSSVNIFLLIRTKRFGVFRFITLLLIFDGTNRHPLGAWGLRSLECRHSVVNILSDRSNVIQSPPPSDAMVYRTDGDSSRLRSVRSQAHATCCLPASSRSGDFLSGEFGRGLLCGLFSPSILCW